MERVGVAEMKARLSSYLRKVQQTGRGILLTEDGRPVAVLSRAELRDDEEGWFQALAQKGLIRAPESPLPDEFFEPLPKVKDPEGHLRRFITGEERG